jgi:hypothetical protein
LTLRALVVVVVAACVLALPSVAHAAQLFGPFSNCSGTIGGTAAAVVFTPSVTSAPTAPQDYLFIQNNSTSSQNIWINILPSGVATTAPPSIEILPTGSIIFTSANAPVPIAVSVIASASSATYTCIYK